MYYRLRATIFPLELGISYVQKLRMLTPLLNVEVITTLGDIMKQSIKHLIDSSRFEFP